MNIKNRLKKLENVVIDNSAVCGCYPQRNTEIYYQDLSEDAQTNEPQLNGEPVPEVCPFCRKPMVKQVITIQGVDNTTKDRFPEEWEANNR